MSSGHFAKVRELFDAALDIAPEELPAWCARVCAGDSALHRQLARLLELDAANGSQAPTPMAGVIGAALEADARRRLIGTHIGRYQLIEEIGQGGMGRVFRALREEDGVRQEVALKLLRREMIDSAMLLRFQAERRILAGLSHPGIARLLDLGESEDGIPFIAMELVQGEPITRYCASRGMGIRDRLRLFRQVLAAVSHAHRNLIVHRDIKPANVLVDQSGQVKLLDFGIAKPLQAGGDVTATAARCLTPNYAAPEQFLGGEVSVMSDVYALGALLFELLAGRPPLLLDGLRASEVERQVVHLPPSTLAQVAQDPEAAARLGRNDLVAWRRALRGDLDSIVHKALRKEPQSRYLGVELLDSDIAAYLDHRPVLASGSRRLYRLTKFVQRHRVLLGVVMCALAAVGVALGMALRQAEVAAAERDSARAAMAVLSESFRAADPMHISAGQVSASEILRVAALRTAALRESQPRVHAMLSAEIGESELALGMVQSTLNEMGQAIEWAARDSGERALTQRLRLLQARQLIAAGRVDEAGAALAEIESAAPVAPEVMVVRAHQLVQARQTAEAIEVATRAERALAQQPGSPGHADAAWQLSEAQRLAGDIDGATATLDRLIALHGEASEHPRSLLTRLRRARLLLAAKRAGPEATEETRQLVESLGRHYGQESSVMGLAWTTHGLALEAAEDLAGAIAAHQQALVALESALGNGHPNVLMARYNLAEQLSRHASPLADPTFERLLQDAERAGQRDSARGVFFRLNFASILAARGDIDGARKVLLPPGFQPDLPRVSSANRTALARDLGSLFGPFDCAGHPPIDPDRARAAAIACQIERIKFAEARLD